MHPRLAMWRYRLRGRLWNLKSVLWRAKVRVLRLLGRPCRCRGGLEIRPDGVIYIQGEFTQSIYDSGDLGPLGIAPKNIAVWEGTVWKAVQGALEVTDDRA